LTSTVVTRRVHECCSANLDTDSVAFLMDVPTMANSYKDVRISDNARVHVGNRHEYRYGMIYPRPSVCS
jgi:hypothetical protein